MTTHSSMHAREFHGQRSLAGYSSWDHRESDTTEQLNKNTYTLLKHLTVNLGKKMCNIFPCSCVRLGLYWLCWSSRTEREESCIWHIFQIASVKKVNVMGKDWMILSPKVYQTKETQELCGELRY